jgi:hypothetical protein
MKTALKILLPVAALVLAGCSTVSSRIDQHADEYYQLDPAAQEKIHHGTIDVGFTPNMVYMALDGASETWIYETTYRTYEGTTLVNYHRWYRYDPFHRRYHVYWGPSFADVYRTHVDEKMRVEFRNGEVVSINETTRS